MVLWQHVVSRKSYAAENVPDYGCVSYVMPRETAAYDLTQYDMLPQHQFNIRKLISECF